MSILLRLPIPKIISLVIPPFASFAFAAAAHKE
jgi:hypothetical protein